jgi:hypothetical protein
MTSDSPLRVPVTVTSAMAARPLALLLLLLVASCTTSCCCVRSSAKIAAAVRAYARANEQLKQHMIVVDAEVHAADEQWHSDSGHSSMILLLLAVYKSRKAHGNSRTLQLLLRIQPLLLLIV